jgi:hypothetical protein
MTKSSETPLPRPGDVICYAYLWTHEQALGREEARKDRPCAIVLVLTEMNRFIWPGPDLRPVPAPADAFYRYGLLPAKLFIKLRDEIVTRARRRKLTTVRRTE